jgi:hypothetical protein
MKPGIGSHYFSWLGPRSKAIAPLSVSRRAALARHLVFLNFNPVMGCMVTVVAALRLLTQGRPFRKPKAEAPLPPA